ncbi:hypothetical protein THAOC_36615 [Thalassiosira oceanica]|uniref:Helicase-associated domain-containing protein n=1 Tax=Thalassiosira oceanica TaxID=159749 RepID=K0QZW9_THAOC|nr:hypothetical protein THAOC_36615 [Thalassiosira oceanica]|eukprot:EJK44815.1 hypothetical protein THAOC_36615 [Thalassiosira oceanica]
MGSSWSLGTTGCTDVTRTSHEAAWAERGTGHRTAPLRGPQGPSSADLCVLTMPKTRARSGGTDPKPRGDVLEQNWNNRCAELAAFKEEHGHCNVPTGARQELDALGFDSEGGRRDQKWNDRCDELAAYKAKHGDCNVPKSQGSLGRWVNDQRKLQKKGKLPEERFKKLEELGFDWSPLGTTWEESFDELMEYQRAHGDCNVPRGHETLGSWVHNQRTLKKKGKLPKERVEKLKSLASCGCWALSAGQREIIPPRWGRARMAAAGKERGAIPPRAMPGRTRRWPGPMPPQPSPTRTDLPRKTHPHYGASESSSTGDMIEAGERNAASENARDDGDFASMPPLPNLPEPISESESSGRPPSATRMSDTSDQEDLIQPDETFAADAEADRDNRKPSSFRPDSVFSSGPDHGDDETVCTAEDVPEECNKDTDDLSANERGSLLARIEELEAADRAKNERIKASEAKMKALEAENCALKKSLADAEEENATLRKEVKRNNVIVKVKQEASKENAELLAEVKYERDDLIEEMMALETAVKVKQEVNGTLKRNLADVKDKLDVAIEEREGLFLGCLQLQELAQNALQENEEVRREARHKLANATTEPCMWPNCQGNRGSQRNILMGCGHVVCDKCIQDDVAFTHDDKYTSEPFMLELRGACACKIASTTLKASLGNLTGISSLLLELENCGFVQLEDGGVGRYGLIL